MSAQTVEINSVETVLRELNPLVEEVQRTLEQSLENDQPADGAAGVTARLTEIRGTLVMLDLEGPRLLVDEMGQLADALSQGAVQGQEAALEVLLKAVFKLPDYLDRLLAGRSDRPAVLLPLINELRGARGAEPLGERDVFRPQLEPVVPQRASGTGADDAEITGAAKRLRPRFQKALLGWYRGDNIETQLNELGSVLQELAQSTSNPATQRLWRVCGALTESLSDQGLEQDTSVKVLMAKVERLLSQLVRQGEGALERTIPLDLLRSLLYYVARSGSDSPRVREVKDAYNLEELLPDSGAEADFEGPNRGLLEVVGQGIRDELTSIRDAVEIYVHSEESRPDVLEGLPDRIRQVADTFSMVGLSDDHDLLRQEAEALAEIDSVDAEEANTRMQRLADVLVRADSDLTELESGRRSGKQGAGEGDLAIRDLPDSEYRPLLSAIVAAALDDLSKLREAIGAYCGDPDAGRDAVTEAPALLTELEGAVAILPLDAALPLVQELRVYTQRELVERGVRPDDNTQVLIADVVAGLEYYLEAVDHDRAAMTHLLESARRAMEALQSGGEPETYSGDEQVVIESAGPETEGAPEGESESSAAAPVETSGAEDETAQADASTQAAGATSEEPAPVESGPLPDSTAESAEVVQEGEVEGNPDHEELDLGDLDLADTETGEAGGADPEAAELEASGWDTGDVELDLEDAATSTSPTEVEGPDTGEIDLSELDTGEVETSQEAVSSEVEEPTLDVTDLDTGEAASAAHAVESQPSEGADTGQPAEGSSADEALDIADLDTGELGEQTRAADRSQADAEIDLPGDLDELEPSATEGPADIEGAARPTGDELELAEESEIDSAEAELEPDADDERASVTEVAEDDQSPASSSAAAEGESAAQAPSGEDTAPSDEVDVDEGEGTRAGPGVDPAASGSQYAIVGEDVDDEIVEVFLEEALGELDKINEYLPKWKADPSDEESLVVVRRAFHTLKGGGRLIGAELVGEFSWSMENMLNRVIDHSIDASSTLFETLDEAAAALPQLIEQIRGNRAPIEGIDDLIQRAHALSRGEEPPPRGGGGGSSGPGAGSSGNSGGTGSASPEEATQAPSREGAQASQGEHETFAAVAQPSQADGPAEDEAATPSERNETTAEETPFAHEAPVDDFGPASSAAASEPNDTGSHGDDEGVGTAADIAAASASSSEGADDDVLAELAGDDADREDATEAAAEAAADLDAHGGETDDAPPAERAQPAAPASISEEPEVASGRAETPVQPASAGSSQGDSNAEASSIADAAETETVHPTELDEELLDSFLEEADELLEAADAAVERVRESPEDTAAVAELQRHLHTLKGGARMADLAPIGELTHELESLLHAVDEGTCQRSDALFDVLQQGVDGLSAMAMQVRAQQPVAPAEQVLQRIRAHIAGAGELEAKGSSAAVEVPSAGWATEDDSITVSESGATDIDDTADDDRTEPGDVVESVDAAADEEIEPAAAEVDTDASVPPASAPESAAVTTETAAETETVHPTELDEELLDSFLEEADELLEAADAAVERVRESPEDTAAVAELQRHLHTLKGGARMADLAPIGELTHELESLLHAVDEGTCQRSDALFDVLQQGVDGLSAMAMQVRAQQPVAPAEQVLQRIRAHIAGAGELEAKGSSAAVDQPSGGAGEDEASAGSDVGALEAHEATSGFADTDTGAALPTEDVSSTSQEGLSLDEADDELVESFLEEADELVDSCEQAATRWRDNPDDASCAAELQRHLHTLKGGARMASLTPVGELTHELESLIHAVDRGEHAKDVAFFDALQEAVDHLMDQMSRTRARRPLASAEGLIAKLRRLQEGDSLEPAVEQGDEPRAEETEEHAPAASTGDRLSATEESGEDDIVSIFAREAEAHYSVLTEEFVDAESEPIGQRRSVKPDILRALHTLVGSAETAGCNAIASLVAPMEQIVKLRRDAKSDLTEQDTQLFGEAVQALGQLLAELRQEPDESLETSALQRRLTQQRDQAQADLDATQDESEGELVDVFLEEADELLEACDQGVARWRDQPDDHEVLSELQRSLHTLKGGARMANLPPIADLTHEVEALIKAAEEGKVSAGEELFELLQESVDALTVLLEQVRGRQAIARVDWLIEDIQNLRERAGVAAPETTPGPSAERAQRQREEASPAETEQRSAADAAPSAEEEKPASTSEKAEKGATEGGGKTDQSGKDQQGAGSQAGGSQAQSGSELIRVQADLLDNLVNYAGEVSIYHSRLGEQMGQYRFNLNEFEQTVNRLREQLRQMEDETEAQILYSGEKHEQEDQPKREDFDPLEFDRYTRIQELSRSLSESVGDLDSIKEILENLTRDAETLLLQQSRVSSELQDGLMQTRMVRFDGLRARLNRVVRQTASQVGKKVQMTMTGGELEVDRSIQERVVAPLEHVLRNAVSHGIESPSERRQVGKSEQGTISIDLHRGGTDVILEISDDGGGIDPDAVRRKAINRGLITADDDRDDNEVIKLILETGFSTADEVTQISGRGVGMDVVDAEIRRLGGTLGISTVKGQGTQFTIRLPVTLAINQAVLVKAGDDTYAIPIASIEGVTQVTAGELKQYYIDPSQTLTYAEAEYRVQHLGSLLGTSEPKLDEDEVSYPVIMVRSGDERVALHIESIQGRREVVVKPLGTPLNMLPGISGATIMADGSVVLILDIGGLLRTESRFVAATAPEEPEPAEEEEEAEGAATPTVLVVDDSITMRKVSQRILSRHGFEVGTAKDGVDAMSWMSQQVPDLILLDIEMPRMDGYEVAANVRSDDRLKEVPIIMVTSRTGDKHRQRAEDIGVNKYLGKPYQEGELMDEINALLGTPEPA